VSDRWVITGANGFLGEAVIHAFQSRGLAHSLICAGRTPPSNSATFEFHPLDLNSDPMTLPNGISVVVHLAGEKREPVAMRSVNHEGTVRLVEAAAAAGARRFVHLSSVGVYGAHKHAGTVDETRPHEPRNLYEQTKDAGEAAVRRRCRELGLALAVLQPSNVVAAVPGKAMPLLGLMKMVACGWFFHVGAGDAWVNYVSAEDVAEAVFLLAQTDAAEGTFIVNTPCRLSDVTGWVAAALGVPAPRRRLPAWLVWSAAQIGAAGRALLGRELPMSPQRYLELTNTTVYRGAAITERTGFGYPVGIEREVRRMAMKYREMGLL
jgi:dihydroflavonol-4-reductase